MTKYLYGNFQSPANNKKYSENYDKVFDKVKNKLGLTRDCEKLGHVYKPDGTECLICEKDRV